MITRLKFASITSYVASIYFISAFFVVTNFSLLYLIYPPQNFDHIDYLYVFKLDSVSKASNKNKTAIPVLDNKPFKFPPARVRYISPTNMTVALQDENSTLVVDSSRSRIVDYMIVLQRPTFNKRAKEIREDKDECNDESTILSVDHLSYPPKNATKEERMEWIKKTLHKSKLLESTPVTRKFEQKIKEFVSTKNCSVSFFVTWIYTTKFIGKREMFSLESILKASPRACVIMVSRIMSSKQGKQIIQPLIDHGHLIYPVAPDIILLLKGTPAQEWVEKLKDGKMDPGEISITQNLSNVLRLVLLYKYGGVYMDTDMIILKDLTILRNIIGIQDYHWRSIQWKTVNNALLIFDKGHPLLLTFMEEFSSTFNGSDWGFNGPHLATRVIKKLRYNQANYGVHLMSNMAFYPILWDNIYRSFRDPYINNDTMWAKDMYYKVTRYSFGVHLWNKVSNPLKIEKGSIIGRLISNHCILCQDIYD